MPTEIPLRSDLPRYDLQVQLDAVTYTLELHWNTREAAWYMNVRTEDGSDIVNGIKVVVDFPLGRRTPNPLRPPGVFVAVDSSGQHLDPQWDDDLSVGDLGDRVSLLYYSAQEIAELLA